ncbi:MAG: cell cycle transcriptional regulator TrcR [Geminicoccaceae bacterium]
MDKPLMPKATAVWLVDNTGLTFDQIADFCGLHPLEVKGIADGEVATGIRGLDPVSQGVLSREELERCQKDPKTRLKANRSIALDVKQPKRKEPRYTPLSKRQDRPDAIAWLLRHHPELNDQQVCRLLGTTKNTVQSVRDRTHWKSQEIRPRDPVLLGLCQQIELDEAVAKARAERPEEVRPAPSSTFSEEQPDIGAGAVPEFQLDDDQ